MQKNSSKPTKLSNFFLINLFLFLFLFFSFSSLAETLNNFEIVGNKSINKETILSYLKKDQKNYDLNDLNKFKKDLYQTNYFSKVEIEILKKKIIITVKENPRVDYSFVEGIKNKDLIKKIEESISLQSNSFFSESLLRKDITKISSILSALGYFENKVTYLVKKNIDNRVNIFYNIFLDNKFKISNIFFIGDKNFSSSTLSDVVTSSRSHWLSFFSDSTTPSKERANFDKNLLKKFYLQKGYYDAQISNASIEIVNKKFANITFVINSGKKFKIDKINLNNNTSSTLSKNNLIELNKYVLGIKKSSYNPKNIQDLIESISEYLDVNNIPVESDVGLIKTSNNTLSLNITFSNEINKKIINQIVVTGNNITEEKVIRNNIFFTEGDRSSDYFLKKSKDNLQSLGLFTNVNLVKRNIKNSNNVNIDVEVEESPTGEIGAGAGFGTSGALITFNFKEKNYLGRGILTDVGLNIGTEKTLGNISYTNPDFRDTGIALTNSFYITKSSYDNSGYESNNFGLNTSLKSEIYKDIDLTTGLGVEYDIIDPQANATSLIKTQDGNYLTTRAFYDIFNDKRDTKFDTKSGYVLGFGQDFGSFFTDKPFLSNKIYGTYYKELREDFVGTIRYKFSSINSLNGKDVKLGNRLFFSENDLRGFKFRGFGPIHEGDHIGGNYLYSASLGTTFPNYLPDKWSIKSKLFLDTGNLWGADIQSSADRSKFRSSVGGGLSWVSPLGPLTITYAEPITQASSDKIEKFNFKIGTIF